MVDVLQVIWNNLRWLCGKNTDFYFPPFPDYIETESLKLYKTITPKKYGCDIIYLELLYIFMNSFIPHIMRISIFGYSIYIWYDTDIHSFMLIGIHSHVVKREKESKVKETNTKHVELYTCMKVVSFGSRLAGTKERCIVYNIRQKKRAQHLKHLICCLY